MKEYLSHFSAAQIWDIPNIGSVLGCSISETDSIDITVTEHSARFRNNGKRTHACGLALPRGAVVTRNDMRVASPELLFLQLAGKQSIHRLILLGLQLCSHPPGCPSEAITTKQRLMAFLDKTPGHRGHSNALRAVKYVENGSASIMESLACMILTLPHALGGYGLNGAVYNQEILINEALQRRRKNRCFVDLYYMRARLAVEYDSYAYHSSPSERGKDAMRSAILERQGIDVMHLTTIQLYDKDACRNFAYNLAARLGRRISIRTQRFDEMHIQMRELLPREKPSLLAD